MLTLGEAATGKVQEDHTSRGRGAGSLIVGGDVHCIYTETGGERENLAGPDNLGDYFTFPLMDGAAQAPGTCAEDSHSG